MSVTWRQELKKILGATDHSQAKLANEVPGLYPMALTRYLRNPGQDGAYSPAERWVRSINSATARLVKLPEIEGYLTVLGMLDGLLPRRTEDLTFDAMRLLVVEFDPYFEGGALRAVAAAWEKLEARWQRAILGGLIVDRGRELVRRLQGIPPRSSSLAGFLKLFSDAGAAIEKSLRGDEALLRRLARDRFEAHVTEAISALGDSKARIESTRAIMQAFDEALDYALSEEGTQLRELTQRQKRIMEFLRRTPPKRLNRRPSGFADSSAIASGKDKNR